MRGDGDDVLLAVRVTPRAPRSEIVGVADGRLRVKVAAVAESGRANRELCRLLARRLGIAPSRVTVRSGGASRQKLVQLAAVSVAAARSALEL